METFDDLEHTSSSLNAIIYYKIITRHYKNYLMVEDYLNCQQLEFGKFKAHETLEYSIFGQKIGYIHLKLNIQTGNRSPIEISQQFSSLLRLTAPRNAFPNNSFRYTCMGSVMS